MSDSDLQTMRQLFDAWSRRDVDTIVELVHEEVEWHPALTAGGVEGASYRGVNGIRRWFAELEDVWAELSIDVQGYHDAGDGRVLELARFKAIGKVSGVPVDQPQAILVEIRDGKMLAARGFVSHEEALEPPGCRSSKCSLHDQESRDSETSEPIRTQHDAATQRSSA